MDWRVFVAWRNFRVRGKQRFISAMSLFSILGVALGVAALIVVLAIMSGFDRELRERIKGTTPAVIVIRQDGISYPDRPLEMILKESGRVTDLAPFIRGQAMIKSGGDFTGVLVNGVDMSVEKDVSGIERYIIEGQAAPGHDGIIVGSELARYFRMGIGDRCSVMSAVSQKVYDFEVRGLFESGLYDVDMNTVFISLPAAQDIFRMRGAVSGIAVGIEDISTADSVKKELQRELGSEYWVRSWIDMNRNLFGAILLEKVAMFAVLLLIVLVACFNIAGSLIMKVMDKTRDIGILKAIGATDSDIRTVFRLEGLFIGSIGTSLGAAAGLFLVWLQSAYGLVKLPKEIYYLDSLPMYSNWYDIVVIAAAAIAISFLATVYPASQAARMDVVDAIRYE